jgi:hypothetical protein
MVRRLEFRRWHIADRFENAAMVEPVHPFQRGELDGFNVPPRSASVAAWECAHDLLCQWLDATVADAAPVPAVEFVESWTFSPPLAVGGSAHSADFEENGSGVRQTPKS